MPNSTDDSYSYQPGKWVTKSYLEKILQKYKNNRTLKIVALRFSPVTLKGESYGGVITRAKVQYENDEYDGPQSIQIIVKTAFDDGFAMDILQDFDVFNREMKIYKDILPRLQRLLQASDEDEFLWPEALHVDFENCTIIFEDLCTKNFLTANRLYGLDLEHAKISLRKMAKMHAASAILKQNNPQLFDTGFTNGFFTRQTDAYNNFFNTILFACISHIYDDLDPFYHKYATKMQTILPNLIEIGRRCFDSDTPDQFIALIHGDAWTSNLMFSYSAETKTKISDAALIDFQFSCLSPAVIDLQYFFNIALQEEIKRSEQENLLKYYYDTFSCCLKKLKFQGKIPTLHQFYISYIKMDFYGFVVTCINQPIALSENVEVDFEALHGTDDQAVSSKRLLFKNKRIENNLKYWLPIFETKGLLDITI